MRLAQNPQQMDGAMSSDENDATRDGFVHFSSEYAQALQALKAIEDQSSTLLLLGGTDDLRTFIDQFIEMAARVKSEAQDKGETHFVEWFDELLQKAEALRTEIVQR